MQDAPYHADVADGPDGAAAHWLSTSDGLRIRTVLWTGPAVRGTVLLFPGRTEYAEKYGRAARALLAGGYATLAVDWRGQGLADRLHDDPGMGHVLRFPDYQHDVAAVLAHARALGLPEPFHLIAHSMGGAIGLRAVIEGLPVASALFSAPMWGILMTRTLRSLAWTLSTFGPALGLLDKVVPGQSTLNTFGEMTLAENELTHDPEMFAYMQRQVVAHPELGIAGPSVRWLREALLETARLNEKPSPDLPVLTFLGSDETIVDHGRIHNRMARWPRGELVQIDGGKHEMLMEIPSIRNDVFRRGLALFDAQT